MNEQNIFIDTPDINEHTLLVQLKALIASNIIDSTTEQQLTNWFNHLTHFVSANHTQGISNTQKAQQRKAEAAQRLFEVEYTIKQSLHNLYFALPDAASAKQNLDGGRRYNALIQMQSTLSSFIAALHHTYSVIAALTQQPPTPTAPAHPTPLADAPLNLSPNTPTHTSSIDSSKPMTAPNAKSASASEEMNSPTQPIDNSHSATPTSKPEQIPPTKNKQHSPVSEIQRLTGFLHDINE